MKRLLPVAIIVTALTPSHADVVDIAGNGFQLKLTVPVKDKPQAVYNSFINDVGKWWSKAHTYSQDSANLKIEARPHGWLLEKLPDGGFVRHLEVVYLKPGSTIRFKGGLGPLQEHAVSGAMTIQFEQTKDGNTSVNLTYNVGGYMPGGEKTMRVWAPAVDRVLKEQIERLRDFVEKKTTPAK